MKHRFVYEFPLLILIFILIYVGSILIPPKLASSWPATASFLDRYHLTAKVNQKLEPYVPLTTPNQLTAKINQYRQTQGLTALQTDINICQTNTSLEPGTSDKDIFASCQNCSHATLVSISKYAQPNLILARLLEETTIQSTILDPKITLLCISDRGETLSLLFARRTSTPIDSQPPVKVVKKAISPAPTAPTSFTEDELWNALSIYRQAQGRPELTRDERICTYARKRVSDQVTLMASIKQADYPNPDKYPLDAHQGFTQDADSGYAFDVTGVNHLAENLAYYPGAQSAIHIIEWGWDTSTEGHRETQLSTEFTKACLAGGDGFYVAIFGN